MTNTYLNLTTGEKMKKINKGFTLAEVLITLGIIGVVAAMTIPNLIATHKAKRLRAQFLKSYSIIRQVFKRMEDDGVSLDPKSYSKEGKLYNEFKPYLVISKSGLYCGIEHKYKTFNDKKKYNSTWLDDGYLILQDGTTLLFENCINSSFILVSVDINGYNTPPNKAGHDLFVFQFIDGELKAMGEKGTRYENDVDKYCSLNNDTDNINGITCAYKAKNDPEYFNKIIRKH